MTQRKLLTGGVEPHELTTDDRRKGAETTNAKRRAQREEAERVALEQLATLRLKAWTKLGLLVDADSESVQATAVKEILDRDLGKPGQPFEVSGPEGEPVQVEHTGRLTLADVAEQLARYRSEPGTSD